MHPAKVGKTRKSTVPLHRPEILGVLNMRARPEIAPHLIAARMRHWLSIARCPIMNTKVPTWRARKNYLALMRKYPEIAAALSYTEALSFPSPLHGLWSAVQQPIDPPAPAQEQPSAGTPAYVSQETIRGIPRQVSLDDEVL